MNTYCPDARCLPISSVLVCRVEAVQHGVAEVDALDDVHAVHPGEPIGQIAGQIGAVHPHPDGEVLGGGVELVQVVLPLVEVVADLFVRHGDGPRPRAEAAAVGEPVLGRGGQLRGGESVATMQVDHRAGDGRMRSDDVGDLGRVDVDAEVAVQRHLAQLGDQPGVVLRGEERGVHAEHLGDAQQHGDRQRTDVVLDLIQVAGGDVEHLSQCGLAESALAAKLSHARSDEGLGHVSQRNNPAKAAFAFLAMRRSWQYFEL